MAKRKNTKSELGKGISALLGDIKFGLDEVTEENKELLNTIAEIPVDQIEVNPFQPRMDFNKERLEELASSIKTHGVVQPITVRIITKDEYQLIAGERRLRASKLAGLKTIPAYIRTADDQEMLEIALIENIQREDLNPIEVAQNYRRLIDECALLHEDLASRLGKSRTTITNFLRLLKLPPELQKGLKTRTISMGHARALITIDKVEQQLEIYRQIVENSLSVRQVEQLVRNLVAGKKTASSKKPSRLSPTYQKVEDNLSSHLSTKVNLKVDKKGAGEIVIKFDSTKTLNRILDLIQ